MPAQTRFSLFGSGVWIHKIAGAVHHDAHAFVQPVDVLGVAGAAEDLHGNAFDGDQRLVRIQHLDLGAASDHAEKEFMDVAVGGVGLHHLDEVVQGFAHFAAAIYDDPVEMAEVDLIPEQQLADPAQPVDPEQFFVSQVEVHAILLVCVFFKIA